MNQALLSSKNMCWCTPQDFFDKLDSEFNFVLDPAATDKTAKCGLYYTPKRTDFRRAGIAAVQYFATRPTEERSVNGCGRRLKRRAVGIQLFYLSPRGQIRHTFTITFTEKRKFALFVGVCGSRMKTEMSLLLRHFPLW